MLWRRHLVCHRNTYLTHQGDGEIWETSLGKEHSSWEPKDQSHFAMWKGWGGRREKGNRVRNTRLYDGSDSMEDMVGQETERRSFWQKQSSCVTECTNEVEEGGRRWIISDFTAACGTLDFFLKTMGRGRKSKGFQIFYVILLLRVYHSPSLAPCYSEICYSHLIALME